MPKNYLTKQQTVMSYPANTRLASTSLVLSLLCCYCYHKYWWHSNGQTYASNKNSLLTLT